jgi:hypothetical protein
LVIGSSCSPIAAEIAFLVEISVEGPGNRPRFYSYGATCRDVRVSKPGRHGSAISNDILTIFKASSHDILDSPDSGLMNRLVTTPAVDSHEVSDESQINVDRQAIKA